MGIKNMQTFTVSNVYGHLRRLKRIIMVASKAMPNTTYQRV